jgi:hypothetical protein
MRKTITSNRRSGRHLVGVLLACRLALAARRAGGRAPGGHPPSSGNAQVRPDGASPLSIPRAWRTSFLQLFS